MKVFKNLISLFGHMRLRTRLNSVSLSEVDAWEGAWVV